MGDGLGGPERLAFMASSSSLAFRQQAGGELQYGSF
eukprot:COSAG06_NODE_1083_length_10780_cov_2.547608_4_plen_36_part_00